MGFLTNGKAALLTTSLTFYQYVVKLPSALQAAAGCCQLVRAVMPGWAAAQARSRGHGCAMLSPGPERGAALPKPLRDPVCRPQPSVQSPEEEATSRAEGRRSRRKKGAQTNVSQNILWQEAIQYGHCFSTGNFLQ